MHTIHKAFLPLFYVFSQIVMTKLLSTEHCLECDTPLIPIEAAPTYLKTPLGAEYICLDCHQCYEWTGRPPKLTPIVPLPRLRKID